MLTQRFRAGLTHFAPTALVPRRLTPGTAARRGVCRNLRYECL